MSARLPWRLRMTKEGIKEHREALEALARRDDLRVSEIAKALLEIADETGA